MMNKPKEPGVPGAILGYPVQFWNIEGENAGTYIGILTDDNLAIGVTCEWTIVPPKRKITIDFSSSTLCADYSKRMKWVQLLRAAYALAHRWEFPETKEAKND